MRRTTKTPSGHTLAPVIQNVTATTTCTSVEIARYVSVTSPETQLHSSGPQHVTSTHEAWFMPHTSRKFLVLDLSDWNRSLANIQQNQLGKYN